IRATAKTSGDWWRRATTRRSATSGVSLLAAAALVGRLCTAKNLVANPIGCRLAPSVRRRNLGAWIIGGTSRSSRTTGGAATVVALGRPSTATELVLMTL